MEKTMLNMDKSHGLLKTQIQNPLRKPTQWGCRGTQSEARLMTLLPSASTCWEGLRQIPHPRLLRSKLIAVWVPAYQAGQYQFINETSSEVQITVLLVCKQSCRPLQHRHQRADYIQDTSQKYKMKTYCNPRFLRYCPMIRIVFTWAAPSAWGDNVVETILASVTCGERHNWLFDVCKFSSKYKQAGNERPTKEEQRKEGQERSIQFQISWSAYSKFNWSMNKAEKRTL